MKQVEAKKKEAEFNFVSFEDCNPNEQGRKREVSWQKAPTQFEPLSSRVTLENVFKKIINILNSTKW